MCEQAVWLDHGEARLVGPAGEVVDAYLAEVNRREQAQIEERSGALLSGAAADLHRRGTREIEIVRVELLGADGHEQSVFQTHEPLFRMESSERYGIAFQHLSVVTCRATNLILR